VVGAYVASANPLVLAIYSLTSSSIAVITAAMFRRKQPDRIAIRKERVVAIFFLILASIEIVALARWAAYPIFADRIYENPTWLPAKFEASIFHAFGSVSVYLSPLLPFAFLLMPFKEYLRVVWRRVWNEVERVPQWLEKYLTLVERRSIPILVGLMALSSGLAALQFAHSVNPTDQAFGVDFYDYARRVSSLGSLNGTEVFQQGYASNSERPLAILAILAFQRTLHLDPLVAVKIVPVILAPALVITAFKFADIAFRNRSLGILVAFFTATSSYFVIGMYGGFIANWMAIIGMFAFLTSVIQFSRSKSWKGYIVTMSLIIAILFIHVYTWTFIVIAMSLYIAWTLVHFRRDRQRAMVAILIASILGISAGVDVAKSLFGGALGGFEVDRNLAQQSVSENLFASRWGNLTYAVGTYLGGGLGNIVPLVLALIWLVNMKFQDEASRLIGSFFFVAAPLMIFGDYLVQARLLYILPINIAMALGTYSVANNLKNRYTILAFLSFVILYQITYVMRSVSNFYFIAPQ
jgi:hypothetical protein